MEMCRTLHAAPLWDGEAPKLVRSGFILTFIPPSKIRSTLFGERRTAGKNGKQPSIAEPDPPEWLCSLKWTFKWHSHSVSIVPSSCEGVRAADTWIHSINHSTPSGHACDHHKLCQDEDVRRCISMSNRNHSGMTLETPGRFPANMQGSVVRHLHSSVLRLPTF